MPLPPGYEARPARRDDADAITKMLTEAEIALTGAPESSVEDLYDDWGNDEVDLSLDTCVVQSQGTVVGYAGLIRPVDATTHRAYGGVHPAHLGRGIGAFLAEFTERRVRERSEGEVSLRHWIDTADEAGLELFAARGYEFVRRFWFMETDLSEINEPSAEVPGITIRGFHKGVDERPTHHMLEDAFADHWSHVRPTFEEAVKTRWETEWFRPDLSLVAEVDGSIVGAAINTQRFDEGYVEDLGVLKEYRGRGLGEALLRRSFQLFRSHMMTKAGLHVDTGNETGAVRLYERVGMTSKRGYDVYERRLR